MRAIGFRYPEIRERNKRIEEIGDWDLVELVELELPEPLLTSHGGGRAVDFHYYAPRPYLPWLDHYSFTPPIWRPPTKVSWREPTLEVAAKGAYLDSLTREEIEAIGLAAMARL